MGKSISEHYYNKFSKWQVIQNDLQDKLKDSFQLDYLGYANMKAIITAREFINDNYKVLASKSCNNTEAKTILKNLKTKAICRDDVINWIKSLITRGTK